MKVAMLGHKRIPSREGGIEIVVGELAVRLVNQGHEVTCFNRKGSHVGGREFDTVNTKDYQGVKLTTVATIDKKGIAAMTASVSGAFLAAFGKYDVVHFHAEGPCAMLWLPKLFGKRCIATIHGLDHKRAKWGRFAGAYIMLGERCAVRYADEIIVLSKGVQDYFEETYKRKTRFIPNGVSPVRKAGASLIDEKYGLKKDEYILFLARLVPEKGAQYLIHAFCQTQTDKKLVIAGGASDSGDFFSQLKEMAAGDDRIQFTGFIQGQILEELYSNAYLYVLPSDLEGMPLSLLEAMSYGNCCLTSDIKECTEVIEDKGLTFQKGSVESLQKVLQKACEDTELIEGFKQQAAGFICSKYNWDFVVEQTAKLYRGEAR